MRKLKATAVLVTFCILFLEGLKDKNGKIRIRERHGFDPWVGKTPGGGHGNPLEYSCLENSMDRGAWQATVSP